MKTEDKKRVLIISGPTGVGESTITKEIIKRHPIFKRLVTATSRKPRLQEEDEVDYYFFTKEEFEEKIKKGDVLEYTYIKNRDVYYGSYKHDLEEKFKKGYNIIANHDIVGAKFFKKHYNATNIFITPGSINEIKQRILGREPNISREELKKRLKNAQEEIDNESYFYDFIVKNEQNKLEKAVKEVEKIIKKEGYQINIDK